jgi:hypothetical protein
MSLASRNPASKANPQQKITPLNARKGRLVGRPYSFDSEEIARR